MKNKTFEKGKKAYDLRTAGYMWKDVAKEAGIEAREGLNTAASASSFAYYYAIHSGSKWPIRVHDGREKW